jgi:hypothetical protein
MLFGWRQLESGIKSLEFSCDVGWLSVGAHRSLDDALVKSFGGKRAGNPPFGDQPSRRRIIV